MEQLAVGTLRGRLGKARRVLKRVKLWPQAWNRITTAERGMDEHDIEALVRSFVQEESRRHSLARLQEQAEPEDFTESWGFKEWVRAVKLAR